MDDAEHALRDFSNQLEHVFNEVRELERTPPRASPSVENEQRHPPDLDTVGAARGASTASATRTSSCLRGSPCTSA